MAEKNNITYFGEADFRNSRTPFGIKGSDRDRHMYVIGKTGMGKSTMLENMAIQDIQNGEGMGFIDPHGGSAEALLDYVPKERVNDVIYFAPFDVDHPVSFNVMEDVGKDKRHLVANGLMSAFKKIWVDAWSARMEYILGNTMLALLEYPGATLLSVNRMLVDKEYRKKVVEYVTDPTVKSFWVDEFAKYTDRYTQEATPAIQNKIGQFVSNPIIRNIIGQSKSTFDIREVMDKKKILIMNLSKGKMGEQNANLIGSMLVTKIYLAAMSRADLTRAEIESRPPFYFYVDEFQSFANESFADILSEARKYKLSLTIAHQYIEQMPEEVRDAVFGNVGTFITFRVGSYDAEVLEKEFAPTFLAEDIVNLDKRQIYLRLMIEGVSSKPFSAVTVPPIARPAVSYREEIIEHSQKFYARPREEVEKDIADWHTQNFAAPPATTPASSPLGSQSTSRTESQASEVQVVRDQPKREFPPRETQQPRDQHREPVREYSRNTNTERVHSQGTTQAERPPRREFSHKPLAEAIKAASGEEPTQTPRQTNPVSHESSRRFERDSHTPEYRSSPRPEERREERKYEEIKKPEEKAVSLDSLKQNPSPLGPKTQSPENKNALKDALESAMKARKAEAEAQTEEKRESPENKGQDEAQGSKKSEKEPDTSEKTTTRVHKPKEIPEEILRSLLKVEEK